jgi:hypothetical protein
MGVINVITQYMQALFEEITSLDRQNIGSNWTGKEDAYWVRVGRKCTNTKLNQQRERSNITCTIEASGI